MKKLYVFIIAFLLAFSSSTFGYDSVPGEYLVKLKNEKYVKELKVNEIENISHNWYKVKNADEKSLKSLPGVLYAEPNYIYRVNVEKPNDPKFDSLWGLHNKINRADVDALKAWDITKGSKEVKIAVIDTGIDYMHPDLKDNIWINQKELNGKQGVDDDGNGYVDDIHGYDFAYNDGDPMDKQSHGTHCSGTIAAVHNNSLGVAGVMGQVSLVAVKFLDDRGSGTSENAIRAIDYATKMDVDVMSNSWGGGGRSQAVKEAIERANAKGIIFVAAAGNSGTDNDSKPHYPSNYKVDNVISVAAHNNKDELASFSCYGKKTVHIAAPGENILSTIPGGGYKSYSGTSMATPHVSGAIGLLLSHQPEISVEEVRDRILFTSIPVPSYKRKTITAGRLNAYNLITDIRPPRQAPDPDGWISKVIKYESKHPYLNDEVVEKKFVIENARYIRLVLKKYELENRYDTIKIFDKDRIEIDSITGSGESYKTEYVEGDTLLLKFKSDRSNTKWGFLIEEIQYQM